MYYSEHTDKVFALSWSPDSQYIASGGRDNTVRVWHPLTRQTITIYQQQQCVLCIAWSPQLHAEPLLASGDTHGLIHVWHAYTGETRLTYHGHTRFVRGLAWSPHGQYSASGGDFGDSTVQVWNSITGDCLSTYTEQYRIFAVSWMPRGTLLASASFDGTVVVRDALTDDTRLVYREHTGPVYAVAWSPDGTQIASAGQDGMVQVWNARTGETSCTYRGHTRAVKALAWSPDGTSIVSGGDDTSIQVWNSATGEQVATLNEHSAWIRALAWSPNGAYIASASEKSVHVWTMQ